MGKYYPKMHCSMMTDALSIFGAKRKITLTGAQQSKGIPCKMAHLILITLYFILKLTYISM